MSLYWVCSCGRKYEQRPRIRQDWDVAVRHQKEHERNKEPDRFLGLFDEEGQLRFDSFSYPMAVEAGVLPRASDGERGQPEEPERGPIRARFQTYRITLPAHLLVYFENARLVHPSQYPDLSEETIRRWIENVISAYYLDHSDVYEVGAYIESVFRGRAGSNGGAVNGAGAKPHESPPADPRSGSPGVDETAPGALRLVPEAVAQGVREAVTGVLREFREEFSPLAVEPKIESRLPQEAASQAVMEAVVRRVVDLGLRIQDVADEFGISVSTVAYYLDMAVKRGEIVKVARGRYERPSEEVGGRGRGAQPGSPVQGPAGAQLREGEGGGEHGQGGPGAGDDDGAARAGDPGA